MAVLFLMTTMAAAQVHCSIPAGERYDVFIRGGPHETADIRLQNPSSKLFVRHYADKDGVIGLRIVVAALAKMEDEPFNNEPGKRAQRFLQSRIKLLAKSHKVDELQKIASAPRLDRDKLQAASTKFLSGLKSTLVDVRESDQDDETPRRLNALEENIPNGSAGCKTILNTFTIDEASY